MQKQQFSLSSDLSMEQILSESANVSYPKPGEIIEGTIITIGKSQILVDIGGVTTGIIKGREINDSLGTSKTIKIGDRLSVAVLEDENEEGFLILSIRKACQFNAWDRFRKAMTSNEIVKVVPTQANKGGLIVDIDGIKAFIPVSQLAPEHYPRVENSDTSKILSRLKELIGKHIDVRVINVEKETGKMILSEREARKTSYESSLNDLKIGDTVKGKVTGVSRFGFFITFNELEGLVHISEIAWGHVSNPQDFAKVGDEIDVKVIGIENGKISLSLKQMHDDPWVEMAQKYKIGDKIKGTITKVSEFGAFVTLEKDINGLIHLTEIEEGAVDARKHFSIGQKIEASIIEINVEEHRIALSVREDSQKLKAAMGGDKSESEKAGK